MSTPTNEIWLTQEAYDRLREEHEHLSGAGRTEIAKRIEAAREEGDLKENGGYHAAKDEQAKIEARIRYLAEVLEHATVGESTGAADEVSQGSLVKASINGNEQSFVVGSREILVSDDINVFSPSSPIGEAILGKKAGETAEFEAPNGKTMKVKILEVSVYKG